jgi:hypothetical protein
MKFTYLKVTSFTKLILCFHEISITNTIFPPLREKLYAFRVIPFAEVSELFKYSVLQVVVDRKKASSDCIR